MLKSHAGWLPSGLRESFARRLYSYDLLLFCYVAMFVPMLLSNHERIAHRLFLWTVIPAALLPFLSWRSVPLGRPRVFDVTVVLRGHMPRRVSLIFVGVCMYLVALNFASWMNGGVSNYVLNSQIIQSIQIAGFMLVTTLLVVACPAFVTRLFLAVSLIAVLSVGVNIFAFLGQLSSWHDIFSARLIAKLGMPAYWNATNISATYAVLFVGAISCLLITKRALHITLLVGASAVLWMGVLMTQARSALIGVMAGLAALALSGTRRVRSTVIGAAISIAIILVAVPAARERVLRGVSYRPEVWQTFLAKASERPLKGYGAVQDISVWIPSGLLIDQPHNLVLSAQVRGGFVAAIAMLLILFAGVYWTWRFSRSTGQVAPLAVFVTMAVCGMFDYNLLITRADWPWITFWLPIALAVGAETYLRNGYGSQLQAEAQDEAACHQAP